MEVKKYDFRTIMLMLILFLSNVAIMGTTFYSVIMTQLYSTYEEWVVNLTMSLPALVGLVACLAAGKICDMMDKKVMFIAGLVLFAITGTVFGGFGYNSNLLMIGAAAFNGGICYGMVSVSAVGLITDCFGNEDQRGKVMGWYNGAMALVGAVLSMVYGGLAVIDWKLASQANWFALVVAVLTIFFVPACPPKKNNSTDSEAVKAQKAAKEKGWAKRLIPLLLAFFFVGFAYMTFQTYIDLYVSSNNLGDSAFTGLLGTVQTLFSFVACTAFGFTYGKLKTKLSVIGYFVLALGLVVLFLFPSKITVIAVTAVLGAAWGSVYTYWFFRATVVVPESMVGTATGLITTANSLSYLPMAYVVTGSMAMMNTENFTKTMPIYIVIIVICAVIAVFYNIKTGKEEAEA